MDAANYWSSMQQASAANSRAAAAASVQGPVQAMNVMELNTGQSAAVAAGGLMPGYAGSVEVIPAASLEQLIMNQQRLAAVPGWYSIPFHIFENQSKSDH